VTSATASPDREIVLQGMTARRAPLLAVCGVCGGAGTTTIATLVARAAAAEGHVLLMDTGALTSGLSLLTCVETPWSLLEVSDLLARDPSLALGLWDVASSDRFELRVIAGGIDVRPDCDPARLESALDILRSHFAHSLVVVDCGTLQRNTDRTVLHAASHVAWVLPDSHRGLRQATRLCRRIRPRATARELLITRRHGAGPTAPLAELASTRRCPLVLIPDLSDAIIAAEAEAQGALQAILGAVRR
jgi:MinD-like ATPase involved in chromosome partitioning or flagellar assembly